MTLHWLWAKKPKLLLPTKNLTDPLEGSLSLPLLTAQGPSSAMLLTEVFQLHAKPRCREPDGTVGQNVTYWDIVSGSCQCHFH